MITLKPQQKRVLNTIKVFQAEYPEGVPYNILKLELEILEGDLNQILEFLSQQKYISREDGIIILENDVRLGQKASDSPQETQVTEPEETNESLAKKYVEVNPDEMANKDDFKNFNDSEYSRNADNDREQGIKYQLSETEQESLEIIRKIVDDRGNISRTLLEGNLLYGKLKLSNIRMYNLVTSLENKGILKKIQLHDGEYYKFTPEIISTNSP